MQANLKNCRLGLSRNRKAMWLDSYFHSEVIIEISKQKGSEAPSMVVPLGPWYLLGRLGMSGNKNLSR